MELTVLVCALCTSLHFAIIRMRRASGAQCWALTGLNSLGGALVISALFGKLDFMSELQHATRSEVLLLGASGALWTLSVYCDFLPLLPCANRPMAFSALYANYLLLAGEFWDFKKSLPLRSMVAQPAYFWLRWQ